MKLPARIAAWLLPLLLAGCVHKVDQSQVQPLAPPIEDTPPPAPAPAAKDLPPPVVTVPTQTAPADPNAGKQPPAQPARKHKKPAAKPAPPPAPAQQASGEPSSVSAIGQLTSGDASDSRRQTVELIVATERGLSAITRPLNDQEQKTAAQVREFLKQARDALTTGDVDGAHTLAAKAKVLLSELNQ